MRSLEFLKKMLHLKNADINAGIVKCWPEIWGLPYIQLIQIYSLHRYTALRESSIKFLKIKSWGVYRNMRRYILDVNPEVIQQKLTLCKVIPRLFFCIPVHMFFVCLCGTEGSPLIGGPVGKILEFWVSRLTYNGFPSMV